MGAGDDWTKIPKELLEDCCQLTKANSIEGRTNLETLVVHLSESHFLLRPSSDILSFKPHSCEALHLTRFWSGNKKDNVTIIYTPWSNLKKDASMVTGQVSFHHDSSAYVKKYHVPVRTNAIINRLNKTRTEAFPDLKSQKDAEEKRKNKEKKLELEEKKRAEKLEREERDSKKWIKEHAYEDLQREEGMRSNQETQAGEFDDDFM